jgi:hypothetical protein
MDWSDIPVSEEIFRLDADMSEHPVEDLHARVNSGMAVVIPAWRILDFVHGDEFVDQRRIAEEKKMRKSRPPIPGAGET